MPLQLGGREGRPGGREGASHGRASHGFRELPGSQRTDRVVRRRKKHRKWGSGVKGNATTQVTLWSGVCIESQDWQEVFCARERYVLIFFYISETSSWQLCEGEPRGAKWRVWQRERVGPWHSWERRRGWGWLVWTWNGGDAVVSEVEAVGCADEWITHRKSGGKEAWCRVLA